MLKRIYKILEQDDEPPNRLEETTEAIINAVNEIDQQLNVVNQTAKSHIAKIEELSLEQQQLKRQAKKAYQLNKHQQAQNLWNNAKLTANQISRYQALFDNTCKAQETLANKKSELEYKRDQLKAQLSLGEINANTSQLHADIMENLMLLNNSNELSLFDEQAADANSKVEALREMDSTLADLDSQSLSENDLFELTEAITRDKEALTSDNLAKVKVQYKDFFKTTEIAVDSTQIEKKKQLLNGLKSNQEESKSAKMAAFFTEEPIKKASAENQDRIKNFFGED